MSRQDGLAPAGVATLFAGLLREITTDCLGEGPPSPRDREAMAARVRELIEVGVASGMFRRGMNTAFAADIVTTELVRIRRREERNAVGQDDAADYARLAEMFLCGVLRTIGPPQ